MLSVSEFVMGVVGPTDKSSHRVTAQNRIYIQGGKQGGEGRDGQMHNVMNKEKQTSEQQQDKNEGQ